MFSYLRSINVASPPLHSNMIHAAVRFVPAPCLLSPSSPPSFSFFTFACTFVSGKCEIIVA